MTHVAGGDTAAPPAPRLRWAGHVVAGLPLGLAWTVTLGAALLLGLVAFPLGLVVAGLALLLAQLGAEIERDRARPVLGERPGRGEVASTIGPLHRRVVAAARSTTTWREFAYLLTFGPLIVAVAALAATIAVAALAAATSGWWLPNEPTELLGVELSRPVLAILLAATGVAVLVASAPIARSIGWIYRAHLGLLGPTPAALRRRADDADRRRDLLERTAAAERERIERDLHDGLQPLLVASAVAISSARRLLDDDTDVDERLGEIQELLRQAMHDVRAIVQGLAPRSLHEVGLDAALDELVASSPIRCELRTALGELPSHVASTAYFVVSETVTNTVRHAAATRIHIRVEQHGDELRVTVDDDGLGGAAVRPGGGLAGLLARVEAVSGRLDLTSPAGSGTTVAVRMPVVPEQPATAATPARPMAVRA